MIAHQNLNVWNRYKLIWHDVQYQAVLIFFSDLEEGMFMYDAKDDQQVLVQCPVLLVAYDNPRASEFAHHMGSSATHFCRSCDVGLNL